MTVSESTPPTSTVPRTLLVILRVYLGIIFLIAAVSKLGGDPGFGDRLPMILERMSESSHGWYARLLHSVVLPRTGLFGGLVILGELTVALSLIFGAATRLGAGLAMFLVLNYMMMKGAWFWMPSSNDAAFFFIGLVLLLGSAGRHFGVDRWLVERWPRVPLW